MNPAHASPAPERIIRARRGFAGLDLAELWRYRELFGFLAWRDVLVRYKQTYLGIAWAVLQPVLTVLVFTLIFGRFAKFPSYGAPYDVLILAALLPWQFFANALTESSNSLVASARIVTKVYFPRLIIPFSAVLSGLVDAAIGFVILGLLMAWRGVALRPELLLLPVFAALAFLAAFAVGLWMSALNVKYRDVRYVVPFIVRLGTYITPVGFVWQGVVPEKWRLLFCLNPLVGICDGFRWCVLGPQFEPWWPGFWFGLGLIFVLFASGLVYFRVAERQIADLV